jgi:hypothetical protein
MSVSVKPIAQFAGPLERHHSPGFEHQIVPRRRVPAFSGFFLLDTEFAETGYQYVVTGCQPGFNNFQKGFGEVHGLFLGDAELVADSFSDDLFRQCHAGSVPMMVKVEDATKSGLQRFPFLSRGWCFLYTFSVYYRVAFGGGRLPLSTAVDYQGIDTHTVDGML